MKKRILLFFYAVLVVAWPHALRAAADPTVSEYDLKAAFLFNLTKFIQWPDSADSQTFTICVYGENPFGKSLKMIEGKSVMGRTVATRNVFTPKEAASCDCLFISESERKSISDISLALQSSKILTVGDAEGFAEKGGMIQFLMEDNKIRFLINLGAAERAGLKMSSKLLDLAKQVKGK